MPASQITKLSNPTGDEPVHAGTLGYFTSRNRHLAHDLVLTEFGNSGITQATFARRWRKSPEEVCRFLGAPGNWTLDRIAEALFVMSGAQIRWQVYYPLNEPIRNFTGHAWNEEGSDITSTTQTNVFRSDQARPLIIADGDSQLNRLR